MWNRAFVKIAIVGIAFISSGCCCVDTCCNSSCDFGGSGCNRVCGTDAPQILPASGSYGGSCGGGSCGGGCTECGGCSDNCGSGGCGGGCGAGIFGGGFCGSTSSGCGWGCGAEVFVDGNGQPCYGPIMGLATFFRDSFQSCGCGELYVDEWVSDPPLCNDPCMECGEVSCGGGGCGCGSTCSRSGASSGQGQYARNYNWTRTLAGNRSCGTCNQGYGGTSRDVVPPARSTRSVARQSPKKRKSFRSAIQQASAQSPVKRWGDSVSQRMQSLDVQPSVRPPGLDSLGKQLRKSRTAAGSKVTTAGWFH